MNSGTKTHGRDLSLPGIWVLMAFGIGMSVLLLGWAGKATAQKFLASVTRLKNLNELRSNVQEADTELIRMQVLDSLLSGFGKGLPQGTEGAFVLDLLMRNAESCSLSIKHLQAWEEKPGKTFRELPFDITLQGGFLEIHRFLTDLDSRPWALRMHHAELKSEALNRNRLSATLQFSVFVHSAEAMTDHADR